MTRTLAMDADKVLVVEGNEPRSKCQKLTDFFKRLPSRSETQEFPGFLMPCFLPTDVLHFTARLKRPVVQR